ncbi:cystatin-like fold lipoprotein [Staphylococcus aureus]|uniref:cystatin-like fold lipoprotein n=2 Tax=Staphylococcus aureus TaxID=1280 RepID=UPI000447CBB5|nr:cystatin-like fold lipoprotein [Staphylococcus aureus]EZT66054.1 hypothetical protein U885_01878 [Staphylococcus aureus 81629]EZU81556.1 hypothetical protein U995_02337 [Staphylococcus aureus 1111203374]EZU94795.1 hypothetical protein U920_02525 [Staphylococcus aureus 11S00627]EZV18992.1 hypothetical protein U926_01562 [Staphylococcus aureus 12S00881]EZV22806.1 hypothetical protein U928_01973 [Staphylococcus aureus 12S01153]
MKKLFLLFISSVFILSACGNKYDKEIEEVTNLEKKMSNESQLDNIRPFHRNDSNFKIYENGNKIVVNHKALKDSDTITSDFFEKNQDTGKFEYNSDIKVKKFQQNNKPEYEENNMKK